MLGSDRDKDKSTYCYIKTIIDYDLVTACIRGVGLEIPRDSKKAIEFNPTILRAWNLHNGIEIPLAAKLKVETDPFHLPPVAASCIFHLKDS